VRVLFLYKGGLMLGSHTHFQIQPANRLILSEAHQLRNGVRAVVVRACW